MSEHPPKKAARRRPRKTASKRPGTALMKQIRAARREVVQYDKTRDLPVIELPIVCSAEGVDIDRVHQKGQAR